MEVATSSSTSNSLIVENVENVEIEELEQRNDAAKTFETIQKKEKERRAGERFVHFLSNSFSVIDDALLSFLKIRRALMIDPRIQQVASNKKLQTKLPGFTVRMGYVLLYKSHALM